MSGNQTSADASQLSLALQELREAIDGVDNEILTLLAKRQNLSRQIATKKVLGSNVFRPDREMSLLRNLVAKHEAIDPRLIAGLWRHIISASIAEQKHDYTIAHSPESASLAQAHSAGYMQCQPYDNCQTALAALSAKKADCVIILHAELEGIKDQLGRDIFVASSIGVSQQHNLPEGYILCRELPGLSGDDMVIMRMADGTLSHLSDDDNLPDGQIIGKYATPLSYLSEKKA